MLGIDPAPRPGRSRPRRPASRRCTEFFDAELARRVCAPRASAADVIVANNVMAHTPTSTASSRGCAILLADDGIVDDREPVRPRPHRPLRVRHDLPRALLLLLVHARSTRSRRRHGLYLNDVEHFPDAPRRHACAGGSARARRPTDRSASTSRRSAPAASTRSDYYRELRRAGRTGSRPSSLELLGSLQADGKTIAAYGAAAKGATLVNYVGIGTELVDYVVDRNVHKQGLLMPGYTSADPRSERAPRERARLPAAARVELRRRDRSPSSASTSAAAAGSSSRCPRPEILLTDARCPACGASAGSRSSTSSDSVPVHSCLLARHAARRPRSFPPGTLRLALCTELRVHHEHARSTPGSTSYSQRYEETQGFSPRFRRVRARARAALGRPVRPAGQGRARDRLRQGRVPARSCASSASGRGDRHRPGS